jgi:hypothetical protein
MSGSISIIQNGSILSLDMDKSLIQAIGYEMLFRKLSRRALLQREQ